MQKILHEPALPNTPSNTVTEVNTKKREREEEKEDTEEKNTRSKSIIATIESCDHNDQRPTYHS